MGSALPWPQARILRRRKIPLDFCAGYGTIAVRPQVWGVDMLFGNMGRPARVRVWVILRTGRSRTSSEGFGEIRGPAVLRGSSDQETRVGRGTMSHGQLHLNTGSPAAAQPLLGGFNVRQVKGLILAQSERWRRV